ncbi:polyprenyl synthetase family protein [Cellulomonas rhizosphaerae]|uniref:Polyprenyl synthetase family protein n=1 Tax=Cellulomonas rhizosphaerae TaxID=2293719 RepID=A0A413RLZ1_9CELL|nr:polyprenyl synthetase family protein [Cellulomonas rhizosphaerae]RHA41295.1 polyprenyl synthetase family protein [Cellulomonas rhizosphaerae]
MSLDPRTLTDVEDVRPRVDGYVAAHVDRLEGVLASIGAGAAPLVEAVAQMLSGGKRLRAAFCYWSWRAHGGAPGTPDEVAVLRVGAALELFQAAALFHDDVMDDSDTRRGHPAAHRAFADRHHREGLEGDAEQFGLSAAILLGDLALVASEREFADAVAGAPATRAARTREVFDHMRTEVTVGQYLDVLAQSLPWGADTAADEHRAREVIRAKSARYSVEHPIVLGAALADADDDALAACRAIGLPLGEAFQLRDDLLGVFGDPVATGKPAGDDLREGKRTVLVARTVAHAIATGDVPTLDLVRSTLGDREASEDQIAALAEAIAASGAVEGVETLIEQLCSAGFAGIEARDWAEPAHGMLTALAHAATDRSA